MNNKSNIRSAKFEDLTNIYELCCKLELKNNPKLMNKKGFLMTDYSSHRNKFEKEFTKNLKNLFLVYENLESIHGFINGYDTNKYWKKYNSYSIKYNHNIKKFNIEDLSEVKDGFYLSQIATNPKYRREKIGTALLKEFVNILNKRKTKYILSSVVSGVFSENNDLKIINKCSINFHENFGFKNIGYMRDDNFKYSFLRDKASFKYRLYLVDIKDIKDKIENIYKLKN